MARSRRNKWVWKDSDLSDLVAGRGYLCVQVASPGWDDQDSGELERVARRVRFHPKFCEPFDDRRNGMSRQEFYTQAFLAALPAVVSKYERFLGEDDSYHQIADHASEIAISAAKVWGVLVDLACLVYSAFFRGSSAGLMKVIPPGPVK